MSARLSPALPLVLLFACSDPSAPAQPPVVQFSILSPDIDEEGALSPETTCAGSGRSPALSWTGAPAASRSLAVVVSAVGPAGETVLWTAWDIDPLDGSLRADIRPTDHPPLQGVTTGGRVGWQAPCGLPPQTTVRIEIAALDDALLPPPIAPAEALRARMSDHLVGLARVEARLP